LRIGVQIKFFTREWAHGDLSEEKCNEIRSAYRLHVDSLLSYLSESVAQLAKETSLHDGVIRRVCLDHKTGKLVLELRCGNRQTGYFDLDLIYLGVDFSALDLATLAERAGDRETELWYDEVDIYNDGRYIHRVLFWPVGEISILFAQLPMERVARLNRSIPYIENPYVDSSRGQ